MIKVPKTYFIWNGIKSNIYGYLEKMPFPTFSSMNFNTEYITGRTAPLITSKKTRNVITISVTLQMVNRNSYATVYAWLNGGNELGYLVFSDDLSKCYKAICTSVKPTYTSYNYSNLEITFSCYPFRYSYDDEPITITESTTIEVGGNYYSEPTITAYGSGSGTISINSATITLSVDGYITLDSERLLAYKDTTVCLNQMVGDLPLFQVGSNTISFSGGITSLTVYKNERWL